MIHEFNRLDVVQVSEQRFARNLDLQFVWQFVAHEGGTRDRPDDQRMSPLSNARSHG